jgi:hypothetical protein
MKYIITESKLNKAMIKFFENKIDFNNLIQEHPLEYDSQGIGYDDENRINFALDNEYGDDPEFLFRYYKCEYFTEEAHYRGLKCPILVLENDLSSLFSDLFNDLWVEPFKEWVSKNLGLEINEIDY